eukprot:3248039-Rhodomonas_salina.1
MFVRRCECTVVVRCEYSGTELRVLWYWAASTVVLRREWYGTAMRDMLAPYDYWQFWRNTQ